MTALEWAMAGAVLAALGGGLATVRWLARRGGWTAESSRKLIHVLMGLVCLSFPWCFDRALPVWVLAGVATASLFLLRMVPGLRAGIGAALHGIKRPSYGEVLFAPAVALVFWLAAGDVFLFCIPVAVLALADAAGAVGGTRWGRHRYGSGDGFKSVEGSTAFFLTAFACVFLPLWLGDRVDFWVALWIGLILALLAMMAEGLADRGFDNLIIPVGCFFVLARLLELEAAPLAWRFVVALFFLGLVLGAARWSTLNGGALLGCALFGYGCAVLADWRFLLPPLAVFVCHLVTTRRHRLVGVLGHRLDSVLSHGIACLPWVVAVERGLLPADTGLAGVSFAMAAQLGMVTVGTDRWLGRGCGGFKGMAAAVMRGWICAALPGLLWLLPYWRDLFWPAAAAAFAASWLVLWLFQVIRSRAGDEAGARLWWIQGCVALCASLPALSWNS